ncbi:hypothetical protein BRARA_B03094 [Brassica rapa]|uniref:Uncharacterized protein n=1 Tax=Brassica campestris TaxID=3711 RepID=A0A398AE73_BRACM|nr:hypothetical protein BRARA_B03094 [Brassica rapa]
MQWQSAFPKKPVSPSLATCPNWHPHRKDLTCLNGPSLSDPQDIHLTSLISNIKTLSWLNPFHKGWPQKREKDRQNWLASFCQIKLLPFNHIGTQETKSS